jgi:hypothetical protein
MEDRNILKDSDRHKTKLLELLEKDNADKNKEHV